MRTPVKSNRREEPESNGGPVKKIKMSVGQSVILDLAIWENIVGKGRDTFTIYNTTLQRSYKNRESDEWIRQENPSYSLTELTVLSFMLQQAATWIMEQKEKS